MIKLRRLEKGSKIAIISPSNGLPAIFPKQYEKGLENLSKYFGFEIFEMPTSRMAPEKLYRNPLLRAKDINDAFKDPAIDGIICSIGGYESVRILDYIDVEAVLENPKMIMGFSDSTAFLSYLNSCGLPTLYGPSVMAGLAQLDHLPPCHREHLESILFGREYPVLYRPYETWSENYKDWKDESTVGELVETFENKVGFKYCQGKGLTEGELWGGCIEVLETLKGTAFWPDQDFWKGRILFFETSEEKPLPNQVGCMLRNYGTQGILEKIGGILFGRPKDYSDEENKELEQVVRNILMIEHDLGELPLVMNMDFGHTDPKLVLPYGCRVKIDFKEETIQLMESPFVD